MIFVWNLDKKTSVKVVRNLEKTALKEARFKNHLQLNLHCKHHNVIPVSLKLNSCVKGEAVHFLFMRIVISFLRVKFKRGIHESGNRFSLNRIKWMNLASFSVWICFSRIFSCARKPFSCKVKQIRFRSTATYNTLGTLATLIWTSWPTSTTKVSDIFRNTISQNRDQNGEAWFCEKDGEHLHY